VGVGVRVGADVAAAVAVGPGVNAGASVGLALPEQPAASNRTARPASSRRPTSCAPMPVLPFARLLGERDHEVAAVGEHPGGYLAHGAEELAAAAGDRCGRRGLARFVQDHLGEDDLPASGQRDRHAGAVVQGELDIDEEALVGKRADLLAGRYVGEAGGSVDETVRDWSG
jgi:hypothetical protein